VLLLERGAIASDTSAQSFGILRIYYSVRPNVAVARAALAMFQDFNGLVEDEEADCGYVRTDYLAVAREGAIASALLARGEWAMRRAVSWVEAVSSGRAASSRCTRMDSARAYWGRSAI